MKDDLLAVIGRSIMLLTGGMLCAFLGVSLWSDSEIAGGFLILIGAACTVSAAYASVVGDETN